MQITRELLDKLSYLHLKEYAKQIDKLDRVMELFNSALMNRSVNVKKVMPIDYCDRGLYGLALEAQRDGPFMNFAEMRTFFHTGLSRVYAEPLPSPLPPYIRLSILPNGIWVGQPDDLLAYLEERREDIKHNEKGLGKKLAEVIFEDVKIV